MVDSLKRLIRGQGEMQIGLWGAADSGKTHLLNASADFARKNSVSLQLYDARQLRACNADEFGGFGQCEVLAFDNLDAIAGDTAWETQIYQVVNRCRAGEFRLLFTLRDRPEHLPASLDDFRTRLQWGLLLQLPAHDDTALRRILRRRASLLGFDLPEDVIGYLMRHYARDLSAQMAILQQLDGASLTQQRRVTIPLVKKTLARD